MNLRLIEKRFQHLDAHANYVNYKFNPHGEKIEGLRRHPYLDELRVDHADDAKIYGLDPFITQPVDKNKLEKQKLRGGDSSESMTKGRTADSLGASVFGDTIERDENRRARSSFGRKATVNRKVAGGSDLLQNLADRPQTSKTRADELFRRQPPPMARSFGQRARSGLGRKSTRSERQLLQKKINKYKSTSHYDWNLGSASLAQQ